MTDHRHAWNGRMRTCERKHRDVSRGEHCVHWVCSQCGDIDARNYNVLTDAQFNAWKIDGRIVR